MLVNVDDDRNWKIITSINNVVNSKMEYESDISQYNKEDYWNYPDNWEGDCEDYAIAKKIRLQKYNIPSYFATCWVDSGEYHAVLIIHSTSGDLVLDSINYGVSNFSDLSYKWDKIEGEDGKWFHILES